MSGKPPTHLLIALHGWGANANDLAPLTSLFNLPDYQFIFPNAPFPHPQVSGGKAWYSLETREYQGLVQSRQMLLEWLLSLESMTGVPLNRTILSGFSQGGAMTLDVGLILPLAGLCCLSGYLHSEPQAGNSSLPSVLVAHGRQDSVVPVTAAQQAKAKLTALGAKVAYQEFDIGHEISPDVLEFMQKFIRTC